jgi:hypothetical protein
VSSSVHRSAADEGELALAAALPMDVVPDVTFIHCRCIAMAAVQGQAEERSAPLFLATFRFQVDAAGEVERLPWLEPVYDIDAPAPRYRRSIHAQQSTWRMELPLAAARQIERRLGGLAGGSQASELPATINSPLLRFGTSLFTSALISGERPPSMCQATD